MSHSFPFWSQIGVFDGTGEVCFIGSLNGNQSGSCVTSTGWSGLFIISNEEFGAGRVCENMQTTLQVGDFVVVDHATQAVQCIEIIEKVTQAQYNSGNGTTLSPVTFTPPGGHGTVNVGDTILYGDLATGQYATNFGSSTVYTDCSSCLSHGSPTQLYHGFSNCTVGSNTVGLAIDSTVNTSLTVASNEAVWVGFGQPSIGDVFHYSATCFVYEGLYAEADPDVIGNQAWMTSGAPSYSSAVFHPQCADCLSPPACTQSWWDIVSTMQSTTSAVGVDDGSFEITLSSYSIGEQPLCMPELYVESNPAGSFSQTVILNPTSTPHSTIGILDSLPPGDYTYVLSFTDGVSGSNCPGAACGSNGTFTIVGATPTACQIYTYNSTSGTCNGVELKIDVDSPNADYMVNWVNSSGVTVQTDTGSAGSGSVSHTYLATTTEDIMAAINITGSPTCTYTNPVWTHTFTGIVQTFLTATISGTDETVAGANNGTATVIATGGTGTLTYAWSHGGSQATVSNLAPGSYTCVVTDSAGCNTTVYITINSGILYPSPDSLDVCLNLDTGTFEFTDNNIYIPGGFTPCTLAITIKHSNGTVAYPGSLANPDIFTDTDLPSTRTYMPDNKLGANYSIPIPMSSSNNYIDDVYEITIDWDFTGGGSVDYSSTVYLNASDIELFGGITIDAVLHHDCSGDIESRDNTNYNVSSIPFTFTRTHELYPPASSGLSSPIVSTGMDYISYDLYEGGWMNMIVTNIVWDIPPAPSSTVVYIGACVIRTIIGSFTDNVACNIDPCSINQHIQKLKNRYDDAVCKRDIVKINKYRDKYQRAIELFTLYVLGNGLIPRTSGCAEDYSELWDILEITNLDDITDLSCCGDPSSNMNMAGAGNNTFESITCDTNGGGINDGGGGGSGPGDPGDPDPPDPPSCPCVGWLEWSDSLQASGIFVPGDYAFRTITGTDGIDYDLCFQVSQVPTTWTADPAQSPYTDGGLYWTFIPCNNTNGLIWGCTDPLASNYDSTAIIDDGSCTIGILGCTDLSANNYDPLATVDDGSCIYNPNANPTPWFYPTGQAGEATDGCQSPNRWSAVTTDSDDNIYLAFQDKTGNHAGIFNQTAIRKFDKALGTWSNLSEVPIVNNQYHVNPLVNNNTTNGPSECATYDYSMGVRPSIVIDSNNDDIYICSLQGAGYVPTYYMWHNGIMLTHKYTISTDTWEDITHVSSWTMNQVAAPGLIDHYPIGVGWDQNHAPWLELDSQGVLYQGSSQDGLRKYDPATGIWTDLGRTDNTGASLPDGINNTQHGTGDAVCSMVNFRVDKTTDKVWMTGKGKGNVLYEYDPVADNWIPHGNTPESNGVERGGKLILSSTPSANNTNIPTFYKVFNAKIPGGQGGGDHMVYAYEFDGVDWNYLPDAGGGMTTFSGDTMDTWQPITMHVGHGYQLGRIVVDAACNSNGHLIVTYMDYYSYISTQLFDGTNWNFVGEKNYSGGQFVSLHISSTDTLTTNYWSSCKYEMMQYDDDLYSHSYNGLVGCMDAMALNYMPTATINDWSCYYHDTCQNATINGVSTPVTLFPDLVFEAILEANGHCDGELGNGECCTWKIKWGLGQHTFSNAGITDITGIENIRGCGDKWLKFVGNSISTIDIQNNHIYAMEVEDDTALTSFKWNADPNNGSGLEHRLSALTLDNCSALTSIEVGVAGDYIGAGCGWGMTTAYYTINNNNLLTSITLNHQNETNWPGVYSNAGKLPALESLKLGYLKAISITNNDIITSVTVGRNSHTVFIEDNPLLTSIDVSEMGPMNYEEDFNGNPPAHCGMTLGPSGHQITSGSGVYPNAITCQRGTMFWFRNNPNLEHIYLGAELPLHYICISIGEYSTGSNVSVVKIHVGTSARVTLAKAIYAAGLVLAINPNTGGTYAENGGFLYQSPINNFDPNTQIVI